MIEGLVLRSTGSWYEVLHDSIVYRCRLRGKIKLKGVKVTNPVAVGDQVKFEVENKAEQTGIIAEVIPRENYIIRKSPHKTSHGHIIAANLDQAMLIVTLIFPKTSLGFIDRFLVAAEAFRIPAVLVFNKSDIYSEEVLNYYHYLKSFYEHLSYACLLISAREEEGLDLFRQQLDHKKTLLSGHSGVGKSTILNKIRPDLELKTGDVSTFADKGVHTTTFAEMFQLDADTFVIDTPGIKEFGLIDIDKEEISHFFPELRDLFGQCRFYNCTHTHEPGCAVLEGLEAGTIAGSRYESYLSMLDDQDNRR
ncbi:MAG: ribosome small subunit-dependent GTPase A [Candidatus Cyclobacteriaceae bacterium M3_2C_046]